VQAHFNPNTKMKKIGFFIQFLLILLVWSSPFWLSWKLILAGIFIYYFQLIILKEDFLTRLNFKTKERGQMTFYSFILEKINIKIDRKRVQLTADYIFPWLIFLISLKIQGIL
jgi:hypothetical protein